MHKVFLFNNFIIFPTRHEKRLEFYFTYKQIQIFLFLFEQLILKSF